MNQADCRSSACCTHWFRLNPDASAAMTIRSCRSGGQAGDEAAGEMAVGFDTAFTADGQEGVQRGFAFPVEFIDAGGVEIGSAIQADEFAPEQAQSGSKLMTAMWSLMRIWLFFIAGFLHALGGDVIGFQPSPHAGYRTLVSCRGGMRPVEYLHLV
jgi:hypothetical protein